MGPCPESQPKSILPEKSKVCPKSSPKPDSTFAHALSAGKNGFNRSDSGNTLVNRCDSVISIVQCCSLRPMDPSEPE
jgi:hypothetical protein